MRLILFLRTEQTTVIITGQRRLTDCLKEIKRVTANRSHVTSLVNRNERNLFRAWKPRQDKKEEKEDDKIAR